MYLIAISLLKSPAFFSMDMARFWLSSIDLLLVYVTYISQTSKSRKPYWHFFGMSDVGTDITYNCSHRLVKRWSFKTAFDYNVYKTIIFFSQKIYSISCSLGNISSNLKFLFFQLTPNILLFQQIQNKVSSFQKQNVLRLE